MSSEYIAMKLRHARKYKKMEETRRKDNPAYKKAMERIEAERIAHYFARLVLVKHGRMQEADLPFILSPTQEEAIKRLEKEEQHRIDRLPVYDDVNIWSDEV